MENENNYANQRREKSKKKIIEFICFLNFLFISCFRKNNKQSSESAMLRLSGENVRKTLTTQHEKFERKFRIDIGQTCYVRALNCKDYSSFLFISRFAWFSSSSESIRKMLCVQMWETVISSSKTLFVNLKAAADVCELR